MKKTILLIGFFILIGCTCLPQIPTQTVYADENCEAVLPNYLQYFDIKDNCRGAVLTQDPLPGFKLTADNPYKQVTILATDISGNTDKETFDVILLDTIPPEIIIDTALLNSWVPPVANDSMILVTITGPGNSGSWGAFARPGSKILVIDNLTDFTPVPEPVLIPLTLDAGINDFKFCKQESGTVHFNYAFTPGLATMYKSERNGNFIYRIPIGPGQFIVELHFAEIYWTKPGDRIFDVWIEGKKVLNDYDIVSDAGAKRQVVKIFNVSVRDNYMDIKFVTEQDAAKVSGIVIRNSHEL